MDTSGWDGWLGGPVPLRDLWSPWRGGYIMDLACRTRYHGGRPTGHITPRPRLSREDLAVCPACEQLCGRCALPVVRCVTNGQNCRLDAAESWCTNDDVHATCCTTVASCYTLTIIGNPAEKPAQTPCTLPKPHG